MVKNIDGKGGDCMADNQNRKELLDSLVDIRDVKIDRSQPVEERMKSYVEQIKNPYLFKVGNTVVRVSYANTQATINDNFINLLASM
jgi:hypothetical protein